MHAEVQVEQKPQYQPAPERRRAASATSTPTRPALEVLAAAESSGDGDAVRGSLPGGRAAPLDPEKNLDRNDPCWCGSGKKYKRCHGA